MSENIGKVIAKAIRAGKWLYITYASNEATQTFFWIAIEDIEFGDSDIRLLVSMYNPDINVDGTLQSKIYFSKILTAKILDFTEYDTPYPLLKKLDDNMGKYEWLNYEQEISYLLDYYEECNWFDKDPYQKEHILIPGIDLNVLLKEK